MKRRSTWIFCLCLLLLIGFVGGCGFNKEAENIYDDNEKIAQEVDTFSYQLFLYIKDEAGTIDVRYNRLYGALTIWNIVAKEDAEITIKYDSNVKSGQFKAVLISPDNEVEEILAGNETGEKTIKLTEGKYIFKLVGRDGKGNARISIEEQQNVQIARKGARL